MIMMDAALAQDDVNQRQYHPQQHGGGDFHRTSDGRHNPYGPSVLCTPPLSSPTSKGTPIANPVLLAEGEGHIVCPQNDQATPTAESPVDGTGAAKTPLKGANFYPLAAAATSHLPPPSYQQHHQSHHVFMGTPSYMCAMSHLSVDGTAGPTGGQCGMHAAALANHCTLLQVPTGFESVVAEDVAALSAICQPTSGVSMPHPLFVGQCRFELTAGELQWLIQALTGVRALKVEPRGPGCFVVVVGDDSSAEQLLGLHRCVLFDYHGVWWAKTDAARSVLEAYVASFSPQHTRRSRLPRDAMIVERQRGSLNPLRSIASERRPSAMSYAHQKHEPQQLQQRCHRGGVVLQMPRFRSVDGGSFSAPSHIMTSPHRGQPTSLESSKLSNESFGF